MEALSRIGLLYIANGLECAARGLYPCNYVTVLLYKKQDFRFMRKDRAKDKRNIIGRLVTHDHRIFLGEPLRRILCIYCWINYKYCIIIAIINPKTLCCYITIPYNSTTVRTLLHEKTLDIIFFFHVISVPLQTSNDPVYIFSHS